MISSEIECVSEQSLKTIPCLCFFGICGYLRLGEALLSGRIYRPATHWATLKNSILFPFTTKLETIAISSLITHTHTHPPRALLIYPFRTLAIHHSVTGTKKSDISLGSGGTTGAAAAAVVVST